ncbi:MAG: hypothetical protein ACREP1_11285, partial [Rhodanobacteraceae bacterium]
MSELETTLAELRARFDAEISRVSGAERLEDLRVAFLGRSGEVTLLRRSIGTLPPDARRDAGKTINDAVEAMETALREAAARTELRSFDADLAQRVDVPFP